jgi:hypothetical protein
MKLYFDIGFYPELACLPVGMVEEFLIGAGKIN